MKHVYLSPHLDDAVLSCGGSIHHQTSAGEPVLVVTVFSGELPAGTVASPFALVQHGYWGNPPRPMALRRAEDLTALTLLGAGAKHLEYLEAVYRAGPGGEWLYADEDSLWGKVDALDPCSPAGNTALADRLDDLVAEGADAVIYAPLGAGNHVDHQIVRASARVLKGRGHRVAYYEEYPYAGQPGAVEAALAAAGMENFEPLLHSLRPADVAAKVSASAYYRTQMPILFGGAEAMAGRVWAFAASRTSPGCLAERIWWPR